MTLKDLIAKHDLKPGDKVTSAFFTGSVFEILYIGKQRFLCSDSYGAEFCDFLSTPGYELYKEPKPPLTLEVECTWEQLGHFIHPMGVNNYSKLQDFIGKKTYLKITEKLEDESGQS